MMADGDTSDCACSNIAIMQLFHELKQQYPAVPDQIVSRVIQENCHNRNACEGVLERECRSYLQSYPGGIISGIAKKTSSNRTQPCSRCRNQPTGNKQDGSKLAFCAADKNQNEKIQNAKQFHFFNEDCIYTPENNGVGHVKKKAGNEGEPENFLEELKEEEKQGSDAEQELRLDDAGCHVETMVGKVTGEGRGPDRNDEREGVWGREGSTMPPSLPLQSPSSVYSAFSSGASFDGDDVCKSNFSERSHSCDFKCSGNHVETEAGRWPDSCDEGNGGNGAGLVGPLLQGGHAMHNHQVAVQYSLQPGSSRPQGDRSRSFTSVNLNIRPPTSEPQPTIEVQLGQSLTYTSAVFNARNGTESRFQVVIGPGGCGGCGGCCPAIPASKIFISSSEMQYSSYRSCSGLHYHVNHRLKALLEKQVEGKNRLARELLKERDKLCRMQSEVKHMKASIEQKSSPLVLPKLKTEIERLRAECEKLTAAVDLFSDNQNILPLGETDEEFYRNIYTGQRLQREGSWSCQLCTFRNHPLLNVCEECEMPRISLGSHSLGASPPTPNPLANSCKLHMPLLGNPREEEAEEQPLPLPAHS